LKRLCTLRTKWAKENMRAVVLASGQVEGVLRMNNQTSFMMDFGLCGRQGKKDCPRLVRLGAQSYATLVIFVSKSQLHEHRLSANLSNRSVTSTTSVQTCTALALVPDLSPNLSESYNQIFSYVSVTEDPNNLGNTNARSGFPGTYSDYQAV
jgi:hypothetical protein